MPVSWPSPFITVQKQIYRLRIALFPYIAMITKQRVCNGTLKVKVNLRFFLTGPSHFHRLSRAIRRCMLRQGYRGVVAYIDDFFLSQHEQAIRRCMLRKGFRGVVAYIDGFFIAAATYEECRKWMDILMKLKKARIFDQLGKGGRAEPTHHLPGCRHRHNKQHPVLVGQIYR